MQLEPELQATLELQFVPVNEYPPKQVRQLRLASQVAQGKAQFFTQEFPDSWYPERQLLQVLPSLQVAQPVGQSIQRLELAAYVPGVHDKQLLTLVERQVEQPNRHWPQVSNLILVYPSVHPLTSQYPGPAVWQVRQLEVHYPHVPLALAVYPSLHLVQNW